MIPAGLNMSNTSDRRVVFGQESISTHSWFTRSLLAAVLAVCSCMRVYDHPPTGLVIVTLDTTRADRLSAYGFMDVSTPNLDRVAREGVVFERASSVAPLTLPAHASLFTGLFPPRHGVRDNSSKPLAPVQATLAEILQAQGFQTGAFVGSIVLASDRGLAQGFDVYDDAVTERKPDNRRRALPQRRADEVITAAIQWLDGGAGGRFFLWAHLYDPHRPYDPPEPYRSRYHDPYVGEIAFADAQIGRLLEALDRHGLANRTVVVVAADHGESLGEHGERDHGILLYENVLRVPLMIRAPRVLPRRIDRLVRLVDVMPTVLEMFALPIPPMEGVSLMPLIADERRRLALESYAESMYPQRFGCSPLRSIGDGRFKLIDAPRRELYDLAEDPFEERNIYEERPRVAERLGRRLAALEERTPLSRGAEERSVVAPEQQKKLAALGYISSMVTSAASRQPLANPNECLDRATMGPTAR